MASITIRRLDEAAKRRLRLRAARHGRSMEDEARIILSSAATADAGLEPPARRAPAETVPGPRSLLREDHPAVVREDRPARAGRRVLLIVGGGIAAYKSLDLIRRLKERGMFV